MATLKETPKMYIDSKFNRLAKMPIDVQFLAVEKSAFEHMIKFMSSQGGQSMHDRLDEFKESLEIAKIRDLSLSGYISILEEELNNAMFANFVHTEREKIKQAAQTAIRKEDDHV